REAFQFAKEILPPGAANWGYDQSNGAYMSNKLLTMRQWPFFYDVVRANKKFFAPRKAVIALPPKGPSRRATWGASWGWTIPKFTDKMDDAKKFVRFIVSSDQQIALSQALPGLFNAPRFSVARALGS